MSQAAAGCGSAAEARPCRGTWIVIPTFNEAGNVVNVVERLLTSLLDHDMRMLIVDDGSPDGTGEIAEQLAARHEQVCVLHRASKAGIGAAYLHGFRTALAAGASRIVQMDADLSHRPEDVPALIEASRQSDVVLGSRYVAGGSTPDWSLRRRIISRGGCAYARSVLGLGIRDLTGGFKCWNRHAIEAVDFDGVLGKGYVFQIEMTYRALAAGMQVQEVPITFCERMSGDSKMRGSIVVEAMLRVPELRRSVPRSHGARHSSDLSLAPAVTDG